MHTTPFGRTRNTTSAFLMDAGEIN
jgi:hypothetical protein